jgi:alanine dehydrogenase
MTRGTSADQIFVFDSTGTALEDVAAASIAYDRAMARGIGIDLAFGNS